MSSLRSAWLLLSLAVVLLAVSPSLVSATCNVASYNGTNCGQQKNFGHCAWNVTLPQPPNPVLCQPHPGWWVPSTPHNCSQTCNSTVTLTFNTESLWNSFSIVIDCYYLSKTATTNYGWRYIPNCNPATINSSWSNQSWVSDALVVNSSMSQYFTGQFRAPSWDLNWGTQNLWGCLGDLSWAPIWTVTFPYWDCSSTTSNWIITQVQWPGLQWIGGQFGNWLLWLEELLFPYLPVPTVAISQSNAFAFTRNCPAPPGAKGDPQFMGLRGQDYQVHGIDGGVYNIISDSRMQLNSKFRFLTGPRPCPVMPSTGKKSVACFQHAGSYLSNLALLTDAGDRLLMVSGQAADGLRLVTLNGEQLAVGANRSLSFAAGASGYVTVLSSHEVLLSAGLFVMEVENSDEFLNLRRVTVKEDGWRLLQAEGAHGLLGQTWNLRKGSTAIEGQVDDYLLESEDFFGSDFLYNRFNVQQA